MKYQHIHPLRTFFDLGCYESGRLSIYEKEKILIEMKQHRVDFQQLIYDYKAKYDNGYQVAIYENLKPSLTELISYLERHNKPEIITKHLIKDYTVEQLALVLDNILTQKAQID